MGSRYPCIPGVLLTTVAMVFLLLSPLPAAAELKISNLSVFLNDYDVTVHVVLLGALPDNIQEGLHSGLAAHLRLAVELYQVNRFLPDRLIQSRTVERALTFNPLSKEYKLTAVQGEVREPYLTKDLRDAQRVASEHRVRAIAPAATLDTKALYYVRVRSDVSLGGVNSWFARFTGSAEETPWVQSSLLTLSRSH